MLKECTMSRRKWLSLLGSGSALAGAGFTVACSGNTENQGRQPEQPPEETAAKKADRARRLQWWHEARFGMFIHWGLYSVVGRHEWVMENEAMPVAEYERLADQFIPRPNAARDWARLAKQAGMKYMVMTTKHHDGFCLFNSRYTNYCAPKQACGRDLVQEFVDAARAEGLRVGFYYSLMDWHHPDGARCSEDEAARQRFVAYIHGQIKELLTHYGKIDVLWYDVAWPLDAAGWESENMNAMVFRMQPDILVNNRNLLAGDFSTPEQHIRAEAGDRAWEACMTMNNSWGYHAADTDWKNAHTIVRNLVFCAHNGGNYLLNIGPKADGTIPQASVQILSEVGDWMSRNGRAVYGAQRCDPRRSDYTTFTRQGNTLYANLYFWEGDTITFSGLLSKIKSIKIVATGQPVPFQQDKFRTRLTGLPAEAPDSPVTVLEIECESEPLQDVEMVRRQSPRKEA